MKRLETPFYHFSVDDVFASFFKKKSEQVFFPFLDDLHKQFHLQIGLHLFFQETIDKKLYTLFDIPSSYASYFTKRPWIHFGPHALNYATPPYTQTPEEQKKVFNSIYQAIDKLSSASYAEFVRLHMYSESYELADYFREKGVSVLFTTEKDAFSYRMPRRVKNALQKKGIADYNDFTFIRTQFRIEYLVNDKVSLVEIKKRLEDALDRYGFIIIYTHENELERKDVREMTKAMLNVISQMNIKSI